MIKTCLIETELLSWYENSLQNVNYDLINTLYLNFMNHSPDTFGQLSNDRMGNLSCSCVSYKESNNSPLTVETTILSVDINYWIFVLTIKKSWKFASGWVDKIPELCIENWLLQDFIWKIMVIFETPCRNC